MKTKTKTKKAKTNCYNLHNQYNNNFDQEAIKLIDYDWS